MSSKRPRDDADVAGAKDNDTRKKQRKGFTVGPDNLPDGQHKRKAQQIKRNLIEKAKLKKEYAKVKARHEEEDGAKRQPGLEAQEDPSNEPHPDRQNLIEQEQIAPEEVETANRDTSYSGSRFRKAPKTVPFAREHRQARQAKEAAEERRRAYEESQRERAEKTVERERFRKAMNKARTPGADGKRKLGRESKILLDRVKKITAS